MSVASTDEVLEGFLCPICMRDQGTIVQLQQHFETTHFNSDQDVLHSIKEFIGKAKRKILSKGAEEERNAQGPSYYVEEVQELGVVRSHTEYFKRTRNTRMERYAAETNKLIIRLHKLVVDMPSDPVKRKAQERSLVPWIDDVDVKLCPHCARGFHLARRKHHCRLCGGIMCNDCSHFITIPYAKKLTSAIRLDAMPEEEDNQSSVQKAKSGFGVLKRSTSSSSLNSMLSVMDSVTGEPHIRVCAYCKDMLDRRHHLVEMRVSRPIVVQFYSRLRDQMTEASRLLAIYRPMAEALRSGHPPHKLSDAKDLWLKLQRLAESIDTLSKRIAVLGTRDTESPPGEKQLMLQDKVRRASAAFLTQNFVGLPSLPSERDLAILQERRRIEAQQKIAEESKAQQNRPQQKASKWESPKKRVTNRTDTEVNVDAGWTPQVTIVDGVRGREDEDPMLQQIKIIKSYIQQAREAHKYDEVALLETNLSELLAEHKRQQQKNELS